MVSFNTGTLFGATNLILTISSLGNETKKFQLWTKKDDKIEEVLPNLEITRITNEDQLKLFEHPLETGTLVVDHAILEPKQTTIQAYISIDDETTLRELEQLYLSTTKLTVRNENNIVKNMLIKSKPKEITSDVLNKTLYSITFREAQEVEPVYVNMPSRKVANKRTASRVSGGVKQAKPVNRSWLKDIFTKK